MERVSSVDFDMVEDATCVMIRTSDGKITKIPVECGTKLSVGAFGSLGGTSVVSASRGVLSWAGVTARAVDARYVSEPEFLDVGCSTQEAAEFVVRYFEEPHRIRVLSQSPLLLMNVLELAFAIGSETLFFDGCLLLGEQLKALMRAPILSIFDGSVAPTDLVDVFKSVVTSVRERFCLPRSSYNEDELLNEEIRAGGAGLTWSCADSSDCSDAVQNVGRFDVNLKHIALLQPNIWQPNTECNACPDCGVSLRTYFGLPKMGAISHCRVCGKGKCSACVKFRVHKSHATVERPPNEPPETSTFRKVCSGCFKNVTKAMQSLFLSNAFMLSGLGVLEIAILRFMCETWREAAELCLREYHNMLYISKIRTEHSKALRKLVTSSAIFYQGHPQAIIFLARSLDWGSEVDDNVKCVIEGTVTGLLNPLQRECRISHLHLFCTRACVEMAPELCGYQLLEALRDAPPNDLVRYFRQKAMDLILCERSGEAFTLALIPSLMDAVVSGRESSQEAFDCLLDISSRSAKWALSVYLEARSRPSTTGHLMDFKRLVLLKAGALGEKMRCTGEFLELLDAVESSAGKDRMISTFRNAAAQMNLTAGIASDEVTAGHLLRLRPMLYPFDSSVTVVGILLDDTVVKKLSNSRPTVYTLVADTGRRYRILHKRESVRKDAVVSSTTAILHHIISQKHLLWMEKYDTDIKLPNYRVIPISMITGLIEIVDGVTLQKIYDDSQGARPRSISFPPPEVLAVAGASGKRLNANASGIMSETQDDSPLLTKLLSLSNLGSSSSDSLQRKVGRRFLASAKYFLVLNYLLAIGDRHRDNVVLTPEGYILHIDFGYILGSRPLPEEQLHVLGAKSYVRFDGDLDLCVRHFQRFLHHLDGPEGLDDRDAIDGFLSQTADLFIALRPQTYAILILLQHLVNCGELSGNTSELLGEKLRNITMGGSAESDAKKVFIRRIRESMGAESLRDWVYTKAKSIKALLF